MNLVLFLLMILPIGDALQVPPNQIQIQHDQALVDFPGAIRFQVDAAASAPIRLVSLRYGTNGRTCEPLSLHQNMIFSPQPELALSWNWYLSQENFYLPPGTQVWWQWLIHSQDEHSLLTERQIVTVEDSHHDWKILETDQIHLEWFEGDFDFGRSMLDRAVQSADRLALETGLQIQDPIRLVVYPDGSSFRTAAPNLPDWTGGAAFPEYGIVLAAVPPDQPDWGNLVIPHEIAHLIIATRVFNCLGSGLPLWFIEGFSKLAEGPIREDQRATLLQGLQNGILPTLQAMTDQFPYEAGPASQAYLVSLAAVDLLREAGGSQLFTKLFDRVQAGEAFDQALLDLYGYKVETLDQAWQAKIGFGQAPAMPAAGPTRIGEQPGQSPEREIGRGLEPEFSLLPEFSWELKPGVVVLGLLILAAGITLLQLRRQLRKK